MVASLCLSSDLDGAIWYLQSDEGGSLVTDLPYKLRQSQTKLLLHAGGRTSTEANGQIVAGTRALTSVLLDVYKLS